VRSAVVKCWNFSALQEHCPSGEPFAAVFGLGRSLALPIFPVPRPTTLVPLKVGAQFLRHQLWVETRSVDCLRHQLQAKARSMGISDFQNTLRGD